MAYKTTYPYTDEVLHEFPNATDAQVEATLAKAHALFKYWLMVCVSFRECLYI